ncbi:MAG: heat-inducible transcriptional repressor HrcA [Chloroflexia bacterium]
MVVPKVPRLTARRELILKLVIQEYVRTALPVASETLVQNYALGVSSATVRNDLAALEELGLLYHPHTSAGRVPTDQGYRYFVEHLMEWHPLPAEEQRMVRHQFYQVRTDVEEWVRLAASALARLSRSAAVVTPARSFRSRFKHLELLSVHDTRVLLVLIFQDGTIRQHMLTLSEAVSQEELSRMAGRMNACLAGLDASEVAGQVGEEWSVLERQILNLVVSTMQQLDRWEWEEVVRDGALETLEQPEFASADQARRFLEILEQGRFLLEMLAQALQRSGIQVIIGGESQREEMRDYSLILSRYGLAGRQEGVLGVLGPTRMPYPRSISAVRFIARTLSELLAELHGEPSVR